MTSRHAWRAVSLFVKLTPSYHSRFLAKILLWLWAVLFGLNSPQHSDSWHVAKWQDRLSIQSFRQILNVRARKTHQMHQLTNFLLCQTQHFWNDLPHFLYVKLPLWLSGITSSVWLLTLSQFSLWCGSSKTFSSYSEEALLKYFLQRTIPFLGFSLFCLSIK